MFKYFMASAFVLLFIAGCSTSPTETSVDLNNLYAQTCESENGPCKSLLCSLQEDGYHCSENIANINKNCIGKVAPGDDVLGNYFICGEENAENLEVYNYTTKILPPEIGDLTPAELETKIEEETATVENGGSSSFLQTMMAVTAGSLLAGAISNMMFGRSHAIPPMNPSGYSQPMTKETLNQTKTDIKNNQADLKNNLKNKKTNTVKKNTAAAKKAATPAPKKKTRRSIRRRR